MSDTTKTAPKEPEHVDSTPEAGANAAPEPEASPEVNLMAELEKVQSEARDAKDKHLRTIADMDNLRRRFAREKEDIRRLAASALIEDLLPALDNLDIGLSTVAKHPEVSEVTKGFEFVAMQFAQVLQQHGLERLEPAAGEPFDHNLHEAVSQEASDEVADHHVIKVMRPGYRLNERLLRPAAVVVSSGPAEG